MVCVFVVCSRFISRLNVDFGPSKFVARMLVQQYILHFLYCLLSVQYGLLNVVNFYQILFEIVFVVVTKVTDVSWFEIIITLEIFLKKA